MTIKGTSEGTRKNDKWLRGIILKAALREVVLSGKSTKDLVVSYLGYDPRRSGQVYAEVEGEVLDRENRKTAEVKAEFQSVVPFSTTPVLRQKGNLPYLASVRSGQKVINREGLGVGSINWAEDGVSTVHVGFWSREDALATSASPHWVQYLNERTAKLLPIPVDD